MCTWESAKVRLPQDDSEHKAQDTIKIIAT